MEQDKIQETQESTDVKNVSYKCPSCGGNMTYDPLTKSLYCKYCETKKHIDEVKAFEEYDLSEGLKEDGSWNSTKIVYHCSSCGADNVRDVNDLTSKCPFCGSDSVIKTDDIPGIKPHRVIPFKITKDEAFSIFKTRLKKKFFAPHDLKKNFKESKVNGIYLPSWTYDSLCDVAYDGELGEYYTVTVGSGKNRHTETRVRYFHISGNTHFDFDDILIASGKALNSSQVEQLEPFDTNNSLAYDEAYLAGYNAEHYSMKLDEGWRLAKQKTQAYMVNAIANMYQHDVVQYINISPVYSNITYKYVMLPIWVSYYSYHEKPYYFLVNGETGKVTGKSPISAIKVGSLVGIIILLVVIAILIYYFKVLR